MKKITIMFFSVFTTFFVAGQEVVATQGNSYINGSISMDFTIGEVIIDTGNSGSTYVTQGLHQTTWIITSMDDFSPSFDVTVFPNPSADVLNIQTSKFEDVMYILYDLKGGEVKRGVLSSKETSIQVSGLLSGSYSIILRDSTQNLKSFKVVKTK